MGYGIQQTVFSILQFFKRENRFTRFFRSIFPPPKPFLNLSSVCCALGYTLRIGSRTLCSHSFVIVLGIFLAFVDFQSCLCTTTVWFESGQLPLGEKFQFAEPI